MEAPPKDWPDQRLPGGDVSPASRKQGKDGVGGYSTPSWLFALKTTCANKRHSEVCICVYIYMCVCIGVQICIYIYIIYIYIYVPFGLYCYTCVAFRQDLLQGCSTLAAPPGFEGVL